MTSSKKGIFITFSINAVHAITGTATKLAVYSSIFFSEIGIFAVVVNLSSGHPYIGIKEFSTMLTRSHLYQKHVADDVLSSC